MVHSPEWSTGSRLFRAFDLVAALFRGASGPLARVVHWLALLFLASGLVSPLSTQKARARPGLSQFLKLLEAVLALGQALLGRFLA